MERKDYEMVTKLNEIVDEYKEIFNEIFKLNAEITKVKNSFNRFVNEYNDPLSIDFKVLDNRSNEMKKSIDDLLQKKDEYDNKLKELRLEELTLLTEVKKMKNSDAILAKVFSDNQVDLNKKMNINE